MNDKVTNTVKKLTGEDRANAKVIGISQKYFL